ncbi:MAG TPA: carboxypeptidase-like regulatory domain-containing protein [Thermoanaerobaculia bacterium]|nr:carboxypeptidase-like regulatory domain-containing protein [Thermoanaerobaculia bacterium]
MRRFFVFAFAALACSASAATLKIEVSRQGFAGPIQVAVAPRIDGKRLEWSAPKTLPAGKSSVTFEGLTQGLYVVMASGPQPLQRLSAKANVASNGSTLRLAIPRSQTELRVTVGGEPVPRAALELTQKELRWSTELRTGDDGRFSGDLWEPGVYTAGVRRDATTGPHTVDVWLSPKPVTLDVPDRHVTGRVLAGGKPLAGAIVSLRSENSQSILNVRTKSAPDGRFEFFGVREGALTLTARAASYLDSDPIAFELRGAPARHSVDVELLRGEPRAVSVVDARGAAVANATLIVSCDGNLKSMSVTGGDGAASVAVPGGAASCTIYALPKEGSIAIEPVRGSGPLRIRVREGTSSLRLALQSDRGDVFSSMSLLMRVDGVVVPPAIARLISSRGFALVTDDDGSISLRHIPPGTYEFWPYRDAAEGQMLYETAAEFEAPISVKVLTGENNATVKLQAR